MPVELANVLRVEDTTGLIYYLGTLKPRDIKQLTFVPVVSASGPASEAALNERPGGYQRAGEARRMEAIKTFVLDRPGCVIPPVLLCARGKWEFQGATGRAIGKIIVNELAAIIDGQHRLGGLWRAAIDAEKGAVIKDRLIPFMAIDAMTVEQERQEFVDINDNQKGVKKSLLRYLERDDDFRGQIAYALMEDEESVFKGRIDIQKKHDWTIVLFGAITECVDLMFGRDLVTVRHFDPKNDRTVRELAVAHALQYWKAVKAAFPEQWSDVELMPPVQQAKSSSHPGTKGFEWRLLEETGIRAFAKLATDLFQITWIDGLKSPSWDAMDEYLSRLALSERVRRILTKVKKDPTVLKEIDPDLKSFGKAGVDAIYRHLRAELMSVVAAK